MLGDIDIAGLGDDRFEIAPSRRQSSYARGLVDYGSVDWSAFLWLECAGTNVDDCPRRNIAANMSAYLSAEFLPDEFQIGPSTPSMPNTSETKAEFILMERPGERSIPKWA